MICTLFTRILRAQGADPPRPPDAAPKAVRGASGAAVFPRRDAKKD
jgi:hypothetical protein